jgi:hypothetical protein
MTTPEGAAAPTPTPAPAPAGDDDQVQLQLGGADRMSAMDVIAARQDEKIADEHRAAGRDAPVLETPAPTPAPAAASPGPTPAPAPRATHAPELAEQLASQFGDQPIPIEALDNLKVRMKVDGQLREFTIHELRRDAQMDGAAGKRLEQASQLLAQAEQARAAAANPPARNDGATPAPDTPAQSKDVAAKAKRLAEALLMGDEEAVTSELTDLLAAQRPQPAAPSTADLVTQLAPAVRQQLSAEEAMNQFTVDFKDIVGDPFLANVADGHLAAVMQADPHKTLAEALTEAGNKTRQWLADKAPKPAQGPAPAETRDKKLAERKQGLDNVSSLSTKATTVEQPTPTVSDTIAEMRKARGLEAV